MIGFLFSVSTRFFVFFFFVFVFVFLRIKLHFRNYFFFVLVYNGIKQIIWQIKLYSV